MRTGDTDLENRSGLVSSPPSGARSNDPTMGSRAALLPLSATTLRAGSKQISAASRASAVSGSPRAKAMDARCERRHRVKAQRLITFSVLASGLVASGIAAVSCSDATKDRPGPTSDASSPDVISVDRAVPLEDAMPGVDAAAARDSEAGVTFIAPFCPTSLDGGCRGDVVCELGDDPWAPCDLVATCDGGTLTGGTLGCGLPGALAPDQCPSADAGTASIGAALPPGCPSTRPRYGTPCPSDAGAIICTYTDCAVDEQQQDYHTGFSVECAGMVWAPITVNTFCAP